MNFVRNPRARGMRASASRVRFKFLMDTRVARESQLEKRSLSRELIPGSYLEKPQLLKAMIYTYRHKERWSSRAEYSRSPEREI